MVMMFIVFWGLAIATIKTENTIFIIILLIFMISIAIFLILLSAKTEHWWYEEYNDNEWGQKRQIITLSNKILDKLKDINKE